ncbi:MAG: hypothetical protein HDQ89_07945 [Desulfovibrio sp.]|nr:hypothetical protein [Desulfovibrio sp.]
MYNNVLDKKDFSQDIYSGKNMIFTVIQQGINIMRTEINNVLYTSWQDYAKSAVKLYAEKKNIFIYNDYLAFISSINNNNMTTYQKLKASLDFLLNIARTT